jgi:RNA polymerase sigma-70 factor (ECF subfamily)
MSGDAGHREGDEHLVRAPAAKPEEASAKAEPPTFEELFRSEAPFVGRTLRYLGVMDAHVEDVGQEVFVVVHRRLREFAGGSARAWIRQICVNTVQNYRRSRRRRPEDAVAEPPESAIAAEQENDFARRQLRDRLLVLLDRLPSEQRETFVLYEIEQLSMREIAEVTGCPLQTAYARLHAARAKVQATLGRETP